MSVLHSQPRREGSHDINESSQIDDESDTHDIMSHERIPCKVCGETVETGIVRPDDASNVDDGGMDL